jgi:hypothetical protein
MYSCFSRGTKNELLPAFKTAEALVRCFYLVELKHQMHAFVQKKSWYGNQWKDSLEDHRRFSPERGEPNEMAPYNLTLGPSKRQDEHRNEPNQGTSMHRGSMIASLMHRIFYSILKAE